MFLPIYSLELNPDEQIWNHAKRRLAQYVIYDRYEMQNHLSSIMRSIQNSTDLLKSFFQMKETKYIVEALK